MITQNANVSLSMLGAVIKYADELFASNGQEPNSEAIEFLLLFAATWVMSMRNVDENYAVDGVKKLLALSKRMRSDLQAKGVI